MITTDRPTTLKDAIQTAIQLKQKNQWDAAKDVCIQILKQAPDTAIVYKILSEIYQAQDNQQSSLDCLRKLVQLAPKAHEAHSDLATYAFSIGQMPLAETHVRQALALNPLNPQAHNLLAQILAKNYFFEEAVFHYRQVLLLHEPVSGICSNMANALVRLGETDEARDTFIMGHALDATDVALLLSWVKWKKPSKTLNKHGRFLKKLKTSPLIIRFYIPLKQDCSSGKNNIIKL